MENRYSSFLDRVGLPRIIIVSLLLILYIVAFVLGLNIENLFIANLTRVGMSGILVLAMVPGILSGTGLNFGLPVGILCGLVGTLVSMEYNYKGLTGFFIALAIAIPIALIVGYFYGLLLNQVKGSEMMIGTYVGFSAVSLMCMGWILLPFRNGILTWSIGNGLKVTIPLTEHFDKALDNIFDGIVSTSFMEKMPIGLLLFFFFNCFIMWLFLKSKTGKSMKAVGINNDFATASGINVDKQRIISTMVSTALGAVGIVAYAQSYGFVQLYTAPLMMAFAAVAAILLGGASSTNAKIFNVILGVFVFQGLLVVALPVANVIFPTGNLSEIMRVIVQYGIILYALTKAGGTK